MKELDFLIQISEEDKKKKFRETYEEVVLANFDEAFNKARDFISTADPEEQKFINPKILIADLTSKADDKRHKALNLGKVESLRDHKLIPNLNYKELSNTQLLRILDANKENLKKLKGRKPNKFT